MEDYIEGKGKYTGHLRKFFLHFLEGPSAKVDKIRCTPQREKKNRDVLRSRVAESVTGLVVLLSIPV